MPLGIFLVQNLKWGRENGAKKVLMVASPESVLISLKWVLSTPWLIMECNGFNRVGWYVLWNQQRGKGALTVNQAYFQTLI